MTSARPVAPHGQLVRGIVAACVLIAACSGGGGGNNTTPTSPTLVLTTLSVSVSPASVQVGQTATAGAAGLDQNGAAIATGTVTWSSGTPSVASITSGGAITALTAGQTQIVASAGGKTGQAALTVTAVPVTTTVTVSLSASSVIQGQTVIATATALDQNGAQLTGRTVAWTTASSAIATVISTGVVTGVSAGQTQVIATIDGKAGQATLTVTPVPVAVASVTVAPANGSVAAGATLQLTATTRDASNNVLAGRVVTWSSSDVTKAIVSSTGLVSGVAAGSATVSATSEGKTGSATVTVTVTLASTTLTAPGQSIAFLTSPNFSTTLGVQAGSQYLIAVVNTDPSSSIHEDFTLSATFGSASSARVLPGGADRFGAPARSGPESGPAFALDGQALADMARSRSQAQNHLAMLEANRQIYARYGTPRTVRTRLQSLGGRTVPVSASVAQTIGTVNKVYVRNTLSGFCNAVDSIGARTVAVGQHVIVLADTNSAKWPLAFRPDTSFYQTFANEYDQITYPHLLTYIGNPLAYDASLSGLGRVAVVLTPVLNNIGGLVGGGTVLAFVSGCDFYPFVATGPNALFSNQTEMMYSLVPAAGGYSIAGWEAELRATAAHESKHIVRLSQQALNNAPSEEVWLEEGLAQISSEIWERNFNQATWKGNANFLQTVACEYAIGAAAPCDVANNKPSALYGSHLSFFFQFLLNESTSNSEGLGLDTPADYGAGWTFSRWAIDQYASSGEGALIKSLINEPTLTGLNNLAAHTGQSIPLMLVYWNVATAIFQTPAYTAVDVRTTIPSFNFADIFRTGQSGLPGSSWVCGGVKCGFFSSTGLPVYPMQPIAFTTGSAFSRVVTGVPGTSASFFLLAGSTAGVETLQLLGGNGAFALPAGSGFRVAILRVQ